MKLFYSLGVCSIMLFSLFFKEAECLDIFVTNDWSKTVNKDNLLSGAGSDLNSIYESITNIVTVSVSGCVDDNDNWRVDIKRIDTTWNGDFTTYVRRTSDGTGGGLVSGGTTYMNITQSDQQFFTGSGNRSNIEIQYKLTGMSLGVSPNTYSTTIVYSVVDTP